MTLSSSSPMVTILDSRSELELELVVVLASLSAFWVPILFFGFFSKYSRQLVKSVPSTSSIVWMLALSALLTASSLFFLLEFFSLQTFFYLGNINEWC